MIAQRQRREDIREVLPAPHQLVSVRARHAVSGAEKLMQDTKALGIVQLMQRGGQALHTDGQALARAREKRPGFFNVLAAGSQRQEFFLHDAVGAFGNVHEYTVDLRTVLVQTVIFLFEKDRPGKGILVKQAVGQYDLQAAVRRKAVENAPPAVQNGGLIVDAGDSVVDIGKRPRLAVLPRAELPDRVREHAAHRDELLCAARQAYRPDRTRGLSRIFMF